MTSIRVAIAVAILVCVDLLPSNAQADTDGSYCVGKGYVAIEARGLWLKAEVPTVYIVFVGPEGLSNRIAMDALSDRNKNIHCEAERIIISDGSLIDLTDRAKPRVLQFERTPKTNFSGDLLPYVEESRALPIPSSDENHFYSLVLSHAEQAIASGGMVLHHVSARVVQSDKYGTLIDSRLLAEGIRVETVD